MANPGVGTKFVSVNLNKSYGQQSSHHNQHHYHGTHSSSYSSNRGRTGNGSGNGGGGMVVLSRPRSSQKAGPKLSVPPPLNLPSLRREHERFDSLGSGNGPSGGGIPGGGTRPTSSGMGWTKPAAVVASQEKEGSVGDRASDGVDRNLHSSDGISKGSANVYMPPSVRLSAGGPSVSGSPEVFPPLEKAAVLRGEDFPSLQAALPSVSVSERKQKDALHQKQKQVMVEELSNEQRSSFHSSSHVDMRSHLQVGHNSTGIEVTDNGGEAPGLSGSRASEHAPKQEDYFPGPLPLVRLNPRSDWADDERDTGHGLADRGNSMDRVRDHGYLKGESYWDGDFDLPRASVLPHKPLHGPFDRWGRHDNETGRASSSEVTKVDLYARAVRTPSREGREGNSRSASSLSKDGFGSQEVMNDRYSGGAGSLNLNREDNKYVAMPSRDNAQEDINRRDVGRGHGGKQPWNSTVESFGSRGSERSARDRNGSDQYSRYKGDAFQNSSVSKPSFPSGGKGPLLSDPILNFGREKRPFSRNEKPYLEDPFMKDFGATGFDGRDPFTGSLVGVIKRKKEVPKQIDFHDPVRESFEAELERVQRMQEQERKRIIEEQERALEIARREEEERQRLIREQEEQQRRLEEEAREAAWRAEQERVDAMRRAEEQRIAREEERRRIAMEEERRKQAAKQKLIELEEKIAKRQAEAAKGGIDFLGTDDKMTGTVKDSDVSKVGDVGEWEDGERMVERITTSASSDSFGLNRPFEVSSRPQFSKDSSAMFLDRGKSYSSWRRDVFDNGSGLSFIGQDAESSHLSPIRDGSAGGRSFPRKEFYGGAGFMSSRAYYRGGVPEPHLNDFGHPKAQKWNISGDSDHYSRSTEFESVYHEHLAENYGDVGWGQRPRAGPYPPYPERYYQNPEGDELHSFGRSRYASRQPRVLPPPSFSSMQKSSYRSETERPGPSAFLETEMQYNRATSEFPMEAGYDSGHQDSLGQPGILDAQQENTKNEVQKLDGNAARCDSQSSLSVSSPPNSPLHLSHDDLDESGDSAVLSAREGKDVALSGKGNESLILPAEAEKENTVTASSSISVGDDEEWTANHNEHLQEQEEYDEDEDGFQEEDEVHEGDDGNLDLTRNFEDMHLQAKESSHMMDNFVLGFNEGVEVLMPNDELDRSSRNDDTVFGIPQISLGSVEGKESFDGMHGDGKTLQHADATPSQVCLDNSSRIFQEIENAMQDPVIQSSNGLQISSKAELTDCSDICSSSGVSAPHSLPSSVAMSSHISSGQPVASAASSVPNQAEVPVKLQFGLFSGPSLIPSPIPAIQIGSIQMPLHLHPRVGPSLTQMHSSQPPLFQFGQLRYTSPISQGVLSLTPPQVSLVKPNLPANFPLNKNSVGSATTQPSQDISSNCLIKNEISSLINKQSGFTHSLDSSHGSVSKEGNSLPDRENGKAVLTPQVRVETPNAGDSCAATESGFQSTEQGHHGSVLGNFRSLSSQESEAQLQAGMVPSQSVLREKDSSGLNSQGHLYGKRGKKYVITSKGSNLRSTFMASESSRQDNSGYQRRSRRLRTEFRVRENADRKHSTGMVSSNLPNHLGPDDKSNSNGRAYGYSTRNGVRKVVMVSKSRHAPESEGSVSGPVSSRDMDSANRADKGSGRESYMKSHGISNTGEGNLKRNMEEDADAPLQSGVVRVFEQPGIEAPSDEDDFIEVRSKRQMLNDRREQREKEIKAKSRATKLPRKPRSISQSTSVSVNINKSSTSVSGEAADNVHADFVTTEGHNLTNVEVSTGFSASVVSQQLPPIGTPAIKMDATTNIRTQPLKSLRTNSLPPGSAGANLVSGFMFENKDQVLDKVQTSLNSWGTAHINQPVMTLTQTQLDDAMKPVQFDSRASMGDRTSSVSDPNIHASSILSKEKSFTSAASPINSLLAGEKIQFGAVTTSPSVPPGSRAVSHGIGPPGPNRSEIQIARNLSAAENDCPLFFEKEKNESCVHLEECEAEAEAAASAVAVAAITTDEIVGNGLGSCPVSASDGKSFGGADIDGVTTGAAVDQQSPSQAKAEESLTVSLPADLSVENPPISLWPPLPSPQNSSSQMISHFPGGPSHFPFYEMNPMLGGPVFAFGPHEESTSVQSQSQKTSAPSSSPLGTWQQCHSGVDSFYGTPAGFTGPFISPPGGIPGVQGPPHMVVYNHFAPVGQFGQVGLSFMGTTYIPSGKQPDWKHNPVSSAMGVGEGDVNSLNLSSSQRNTANIPTPIQHLAPGSPLMPMSPLAMFDVSPFQSSPDMPVQARWSHVPASPIQSIPLSMPLQQQAEGVLPPQLSQGPPVDQSLSSSRFPDSRKSTSSGSSRNFSVATDAGELPDELGLVDSSGATIAGDSMQTVAAKSTPHGTVVDASKIDVRNGNGNNSSLQSTSSTLKMQSSQTKNMSSQHYGNATGFNNQRGGGVAQKNGSGEWAHRRMGSQGRNQPLGGEKSFPASKMKQIYVAKQTTRGGASAVS